MAAQVVQGRVLDAVTGDPVRTARVTLVEAAGRLLETTLPDPEGLAEWLRQFHDPAGCPRRSSVRP